MAYQTRKKYRSRREKNEVMKRNAKVVLFFASVALLVWMFKNRIVFWDWINTYFK